MTQETVLITGASAGIGTELAKVFAEKGYSLVLVARRREKLEKLATHFNKKFGTKTVVIQKDLSQAGAALELYQEIKQRNLEIDILVNNAGVGVYGLFSETSREQEIAMLQLNIISLTNLTKLFLPGMIQKKKGRILNVASTAAFQPGPYMAAYYASKSYVLSFSEALAYELRNSGIKVSVLCPGPTTTEFQATAGIDLNIRLFKFGIMSAEKVARAGYEGLMNHKAVIIPGLLNKLSAFFGRFSPRLFVLPIVENIQKKTH